MKKVVHLRIYRGTEILKREDGSVKNENQIVKLTHDTLEWKNYLTGLKQNPFCKVVVERVLKFNGKDYDELEVSQELKDEVKEAMEAKVAMKTPHEIKLDELEKKITELISSKEPKKEKVGSNLEELQKQYKNKFGKKPHHMMKEEKLTKLLKD